VNPRTRGRLLVLEGADGSGKSTQARLLARRLREAGHEVVETREPHACPAGERIRAMARAGEAVSPEQELAWFLEQRRVHVREVIEPALAAGRVVVCDRYTLSSVAYQGARGLDPAEILAQSEAEFPLPDLVLWLDLPLETALARVRGRGEPAEPLFEEARRLAEVVRIYASLRLPYLVRIDARGSEREVAERVTQAVRARLGLLV